MQARIAASARNGWIERTGAAAIPVAALLLLSLALSGCADSLAGMSLPSMPKFQDINPFAEKEVPLPGKRIPVIQQENVSSNLAAADKPIVLPLPQQNESWAQPGGVANNAPGHLALSGAIKTLWTADAGTGSSFYGKLTASPIVYDGKVLTLDAAGKVTAFAVADGSTVWRVSTTPTGEKDQEGFGGGLAADGGRIYAATGYGQVVALDARSGNKLWERGVDSPVRSSPTTAGDRIFVLSSEGHAYCLSGLDGAEFWTFRGMGSRASLLFNASPAVAGDIVVVPYPSGDLVALRIGDGQAAWSESLSRARTASSLTAMSDAARPAIDNGTVFAVGHAGRMIATVQKTGERLWSMTVPGVQTPWVAGETVFVVDTGGQLMAITRREGKILWTTKLTGAPTWSGPVLAGNHLWLTSSKGQLVGVDAITGKVQSTQDLGGPIFIAPVVAGGRMFVLTDKARLIALN
jgi:outer membrane protein assembly factor BamB